MDRRDNHKLFNTITLDCQTIASERITADWVLARWEGVPNSGACLVGNMLGIP